MAQQGKRLKQFKKVVFKGCVTWETLGTNVHCYSLIIIVYHVKFQKTLTWNNQVAKRESSVAERKSHDGRDWAEGLSGAQRPISSAVMYHSTHSHRHTLSERVWEVPVQPLPVFVLTKLENANWRRRRKGMFSLYIVPSVVALQSYFFLRDPFKVVGFMSLFLIWRIFMLLQSKQSEPTEQ